MMSDLNLLEKGLRKRIRNFDAKYSQAQARLAVALEVRLPGSWRRGEVQPWLPVPIGHRIASGAALQHQGEDGIP